MTPLAVGTPAPDFTLRDQNNQEVRLSSYLGRCNVLLVFYPYAFTGTCQGELAAIRDKPFDAESTQVLTVSVDSVFAHKVWAGQEGYDFPLLSDFWPHGAVAQAYGVFDAQRGCAGRGTFIIDRQGVIRFSELQLTGARDQNAWREALAGLG
ncbi:peroxiredoxin [Allorhizocola rhizosphaerae]|uniref:peroxiredoxin n=1 Tax=Allorhizocola rhizosphaerae TaxID=1872709 RepID=UPI000E3E3E0F|nr:peroxiredoxin [Allorhizocola rhizosphaerae]